MLETWRIFLKTQSFAEVNVELSSDVKLSSVSVSALNKLGGSVGDWTTLPISQNWNVGIIEDLDSPRIVNIGPRKANLNLPIGKKITFLLADNGNLSTIDHLNIDINYNGYKHLLIVENCK